MKLAFVYTGVTSYMTDCWRVLSNFPDVKVRVWIEDTQAFRFKGNRGAALRGIDVKWEYSEKISKPWLCMVEDEISIFSPDVIFVCGWSKRMPPFIARSEKLSGIPMVLMFDMPWEWTLRKFAAKFVLRNRLKRFSFAYVPGESTSKYARWLGFAPDKIIAGEYSVDLSRFSTKEAARDSRERSGFLYLGRNATEKGLDVLASAYADYRRRGGKWNLNIPQFVEPKDVPSIMRKTACFILPSRWEPWGVVVLEAMAAGMRTIVSDRVGSRLDLPVDAVFPSGNASALAACMLEVEQLGPVARATNLAFYSVESWAHRVIDICKRCRK